MRLRGHREANTSQGFEKPFERNLESSTTTTSKASNMSRHTSRGLSAGSKLVLPSGRELLEVPDTHLVNGSVRQWGLRQKIRCHPAHTSLPMPPASVCQPSELSGLHPAPDHGCRLGDAACTTTHPHPLADQWIVSDYLVWPRIPFPPPVLSVPYSAMFVAQNVKVTRMRVHCMWEDHEGGLGVWAQDWLLPISALYVGVQALLIGFGVTGGHG